MPGDGEAGPEAQEVPERDEASGTPDRSGPEPGGPPAASAPAGETPEGGPAETGAGDAAGPGSGDGPHDDAPPRHAKVLTVSDAVSTGRREDGGGAAVAERLTAEGFAVVERQTVPDGAMGVASALRTMAGGFAGLIVTTGGTGFGPRDLTPEGTRAALDREAPGLAEAMRTTSPLGRLSRAVAGTVGSALVLNTPGSPKGAVECLDAVIDVIPHALDLLDGKKPH